MKGSHRTTMISMGKEHEKHSRMANKKSMATWLGGMPLLDAQMHIHMHRRTTCKGMEHDENLSTVNLEEA